MRACQHNSEEENNRFIHEVIAEIKTFKQKLYEELESRGEKIEKVLPIFHALIHMFTFFKFTDRKAMEQLAQETHELRMLPIPYGLLPHEMIEIVDNERVIPGLTKIFKLAEDFPYLDNYSLTKERDKYEIIHQRAFVFHDSDTPQTPFTAASANPYHALLKCLPSVNEPLLDYNHLNNMRYTFVADLFSNPSPHLLTPFRLLRPGLEDVQPGDAGGAPAEPADLLHLEHLQAADQRDA